MTTDSVKLICKILYICVYTQVNAIKLQQIDFYIRNLHHYALTLLFKKQESDTKRNLKQFTMLGNEMLVIMLPNFSTLANICKTLSVSTARASVE